MIKLQKSFKPTKTPLYILSIGKMAWHVTWKEIQGIKKDIKRLEVQEMLRNIKKKRK